ncbi:MAG TPA: Gmad2 immunoglobulin-like domain-containing protein [Candidatus Limnocylindria bacterium]|nr:Gmad2 immunoglobulin-like domain-containing protein [Candidatus Limnocylindria bacterium]
MVERAFEGFFQKDRYVIDGHPLHRIKPRAVITSPADGADVNAGSLEIRGYAWSGRAPIELVDLTESDGTPLGSTTFPADQAALAWREFTFRLTLDPGEHALVVRATDREGNTQPLTPRWNALGYANNAVRPTRIRVRT